jgi:integrase
VYSVIITPAVADILEAARAYQKRHGIKSDYVFVKGPARTGIDAFSGEQVKKATLWSNFRVLLARIPGIEKPDATLGGMRTTFITWAVDRNDYQPQQADAVLGHAIKGITNKSYFRNVKYFRQTQEMMIAWGRFVLQFEPDSIEVIPLRSQPQLLNKEGKRYA